MLEYALYLGGRVGVLALGALGVHAVAATTDRVSLGHGAFLGASAYVTVIALQAGAPWPLAAALGPLAALALGAGVGALTARLTGLAFALATLAVSVVADPLVAAIPGAGGHGGLSVPLRVGPLGPAVGALLLAGLGALALSRLPRTPWGHAFALLRAHPEAAAAQGVAVGPARAAAFAASAGLVGLAGPALALLGDAVFPTQFGWAASLDLLVAAFLGGRGGPLGVLVASAGLVALEVALGPTSEWQPILHGLALLAVLALTGRQPR